jgi:ferric-dicitrate binding protein FerR (iron transport regulator)
MNQDENKIDLLFRQKVEGINSLSERTKWNKSKGWESYEKKYLVKKFFLNSKLLVSTAAATGLILISITLFYYLKPNLKNESCFVDMTGKSIKEISLAGGHHCFLAQDSKMQYSQGLEKSKSDTLFLEGEGYFETSGGRELVIFAKNSVTKCKNAIVNINAPQSAHMTVITAISGNVTARCSDNSFPEMKVSASEKYSIYKGGIFASKEPNNDPNFLAWKTGLLTFEDTPLAYAVRSIENYYGVKIEIKSNDIKYCRYSSKFNNTELTKVIDNLKLSFNTTVKESFDAIVLEGGTCK